MALWSGFTIRAGGDLVYFSGDTGYGDGALFQAIRQRVEAPTVALLPIGAFAPRWFMADQHIDPAGAVKIFKDLEARHAIGIHWGVIPLSDEGRDEPRDALVHALAKYRLDPEGFDAAEPGYVWGAPQSDLTSPTFPDPGLVAITQKG